MDFDSLADARAISEIVSGVLAEGERLRGVTKDPAGWKISLDGDGLDLTQRIKLEADILAALANLSREGEIFFVMFKQTCVEEKLTPRAAKNEKEFQGIKLARRAIPGVRRILVVASGKGGVGKSTIAANLAVALARRKLRVGLLDADIYGPSAAMMFGLKGPLQIDANNHLVPHEKFGVKVVSFGSITDPTNPVIWRGPIVAKALEQLFYEVSWNDLDYFVIDLPPGTGDVQLTLIQRLPIQGAIIVSTPQDVALIDAEKAVTMFERLGVPILGLVENMAYYVCSSCGHRDAILGENGAANFAKRRRIPFLGHLPLRGEIRVSGDAGVPLMEGESAEFFGGVANRVEESW